MTKNSSRPLSRRILTITLLTAGSGLGLSMPSCPGQQALQQQVDQIQSTSAQTAQKVGGMEGRLKTVEGEMQKVNELAQTVSTTLSEQNKAIEELKAKIEELSAKGAKGKPAPKRK